MNIRKFCTINYKGEIDDYGNDDIENLNGFKVLTLIPMIGTIAAIALLIDNMRSDYDPEIVARACFALIPGVGTAALLPMDLIGTFIKRCVLDIAARKKI